MTTRLPQKLLFMLRLGLTLASIFWIGIFFHENRDGIAASFDRLDFASILFALIIVLAGLVPGAWAWARMVTEKIPSVDTYTGILTYLRSGVGKYTPGGALAFVIQHKILKSKGVTVIGLVCIFAGNALAACVAASLLAAPLLLIASGASNPLWWSLGLGVAVHLILWVLSRKDTWPIADGVLRRIGLPSPKLFLETSAIMLCAWILTGTHLIPLSHAMGADPILLISAYAFSAIAGVLFAILPGAFGLRDGALLAVLSLQLPAPDAIAIAVLSRTLIVFGDIAGSVVAAWALRFSPASDLKGQSA